MSIGQEWRCENTSMPTNSEAAVEFLRLAATINVREAFRKYAGQSFRHHNPFFKGDAESLIVAMRSNAAKNPEKVLEIQRVIAEDDLVAVHSHVRMNTTDRGAAVVHIFRFDGNHRIAELWDIGQPVPENSPNENGMF
jgi:predicted SnoaL-like aldol condensation-catalyzing enzyme